MEKGKTLYIITIVILIIIILLLVGLLIYVISTNNTSTNNELSSSNLLSNILTDHTENNAVMNTTNNTNALNNNIESNYTNTTNIINETIPSNTDSDVETEVKNVTTKFLNAVNAQDLTTACDYASASAIETIQEYNLTNFTIDYSSYRYVDYSDVYVYYIDYNMDYNGITNIKDVGLGRLLCIEEINGEYKVTGVGATGL